MQGERRADGADLDGGEDDRVDLRRLMGLVGPAFRLVWQASRTETIVLLTLQTLSGLMLPAQVLAGKWALDEVLAASREGAGIGEALPVITAALVVLTAGQLVSAVARQRQRLLPELVGQTAQEMLARKAVALDLEALENPAFHDRLVRAQREAAYRPLNMVSDMGRIVSSGVAVAGLALLLVAVHPLLVLLLTAAVLPLWWASVSSARGFYRWAVWNTPRRRLIGYLQGVLTTLNSAKETRAFGLGDYLLDKQRALFDDQTAELRAVVRDGLRREIVAALVSSVINAAGLLLVLWLHFSDRISLAETAATAGALLLMLPRVNWLVTSLGLLHENALFVEDFWSFLRVARRQVASPSAQGPPPTLTRLCVEDLTFAYPDSSTPAVKGVSMELGRGETVALVGENGAGKTTLVKLICRLYEPKAGTISWDGRDLTSWEPDELRRHIAVIFQDFVRYQLSAQENIGFGDIGAIDDSTRIGDAARRAGAADFLQRLPDGYHTTLGRLFHEGHELSSGQWQRVALARAFFRDAPLVIMDEPTASLDARAEYELFETMRELFRDRAVLLISHRFSSVRMADRIYVLRHGEVIESGAHEELLRRGGLYAELFELQASSYLPAS